MSLISLCPFVYDFLLPFVFRMVCIYMGAHQLCYACVSDTFSFSYHIIQSRNEKITTYSNWIYIWLNNNCNGTIANWSIEQFNMNIYIYIFRLAFLYTIRFYEMKFLPTWLDIVNVWINRQLDLRSFFSFSYFADYLDRFFSWALYCWFER